MRTFGEIPGFPEGTRFDSREKLSKSGVHPPTQAGISGSQNEGADSIVLSGGYEDDEDLGDEVVYTGHGGRDATTNKQVEHQTLTRGNLALAHSSNEGLPVRIVRGANLGSQYAPKSGYRYDGLYLVEDYWQEKGQSGYRVWRYRLTKLPSAPLKASKEASTESKPTSRKQTTILRLVRDTEQSRKIKKLYDYHCQVYDTRLEGIAGPYAEAAHIRPLGAPHHGPDTADNILCLCPNHHVLFDRGGFSIEDDLTVTGEEKKLRTNPQHQINPDYLRYHRDHYGPEL